MTAQETKPKKCRRKKQTTIDRLEALGDDLVGHLTAIAGSWDDFCGFLSAQQEPRLDPKRLRDFIAAYHELFRTLLDVQDGEAKQEVSNPVVILPQVTMDEE
ncbi:MAG: hypothetical protein J6L88_00305 [Clostridia bacterium]|nr:hypothetical protein [Clostridia bacterium]